MRDKIGGVSDLDQVILEVDGVEREGGVELPEETLKVLRITLEGYRFWYFRLWPNRAIVGLFIC